MSSATLERGAQVGETLRAAADDIESLSVVGSERHPKEPRSLYRQHRSARLPLRAGLHHSRHLVSSFLLRTTAPPPLIVTTGTDIRGARASQLRQATAHHVRLLFVLGSRASCCSPCSRRRKEGKGERVLYTMLGFAYIWKFFLTHLRNLDANVMGNAEYVMRTM